jgi:F-type H+-transporting ATPase subunit b
MQAAAPATTETAQSPGNAGFPPFRTETYPSQIFWLTITFAFLFVVLWRYAGPRIHGVLTERRNSINRELAQAEQDRREAEQTWATYQNTLVEARQRTRVLIEDNRAHVRADAERAEKAADREADEALAKAEARLAELRAQSREHIRRAAEEAAQAMVARLIGETVSHEEAAAAVAAVRIP